ncbi:MAG: M48 family metalloprotease, partial [Anaerolineae bacterium]|nr:M48 family metalloprotease [Anaerolineae bacterium]NIN96102.1 M48 family metalloprotease [Anaerolineae bacterium]
MFPTVLFRSLLGMGLLILFFQGCAQNPVSGRSEVALISAEKEREIGAELASQVKEGVGLVEDHELVAYVRAIGSRLAQHSPRRDINYTFNVVDMVEPNAFALPGGYVYVSRGLLPLVNSEDELAGVIAHEIAHVAARHAVQRVNVSAITAPVRIATGITGLATSIVSPRLGQMVAGVGQVASGLVLAPYSRDQEREADRIGQELAARAGWDPKGIATFLETLGREEALRSGEPPRVSFFATHPSTPDRVTRTTRHATGLTPSLVEPIARDRADLLARLDGLLVGNSPAEGVFFENQFLQPDLDFTLHFPPKWDTVNAPNLVAAKAPDEDVLVLVQLVGQGDDPF